MTNNKILGWVAIFVYERKKSNIICHIIDDAFKDY